MKYVAFLFSLFLCLITSADMVMSMHTHKMDTYTIDTHNSVALIFELDDILFAVDEGKFLSKFPFGRSFGSDKIAHYSKLLLEKLHNNHEFDNLKLFYDTDQNIRPINVLYHGRSMPSLWCAYFLGAVSNQQIYDKACQILESSGFFDKKILTQAAQIAFDPTKEVDYLVLIEPVYHFILRCKQHAHIKLFLTSNKSRATFQALMQRYPQILSLFDGIRISCISSLLKPQPAVYEDIAAEYGLDHANCHVIESQREYLACIPHPMKAYLVEKYNCAPLEQALSEQHII